MSPEESKGTAANMSGAGVEDKRAQGPEEQQKLPAPTGGEEFHDAIDDGTLPVPADRSAQPTNDEIVEDDTITSSQTDNGPLKMDTHTPIEDTNNDEQPGSAFSSSSSDYTDREDDEGPLIYRDSKQQEGEDRSGELSDCVTGYHDVIDQHPNSDTEDSGSKSERPITPPRQGTVGTPDFSPNTKRRIDYEAYRGYHYDWRPTKRLPHEDHDDFWVNAMNRVTGRNKPRTKNDGSTGPGRHRVRSPLSSVEENRDPIERPATPEPTEVEEDVVDNDDPSTADAQTGDEVLTRPSSNDENEPTTVADEVVSAAKWNTLVELSEKSKLANWADDDDDYDWRNDLESVSSRRSSVSSSAPEPLPKVGIIEEPEPSNMTHRVDALHKRNVFPIEDEQLQSDASDLVKESLGAPGTTKDSAPANTALEFEVDQGLGSTGPLGSTETPQAMEELVSEDIAVVELEGVKPQSLVATGKSFLMGKKETQTSPVSSSSPDSISPSSAASIEILEQATGLDNETAQVLAEELNEQLEQMHDSGPPKSKEEANAKLRMNRALIRWQQENLEFQGRLKKQRRVRPPKGEEEFMDFMKTKAWEYRRERDAAREVLSENTDKFHEMEREFDDIRLSNHFLNRDLDDREAALEMRNQEIEALEEKIEKLKHKLKVAEEELKWAKAMCPTCGGSMPESSKDESSADGDDSSCQGRCKALEENLANLEQSQKNLTEDYDKQVQQLAVENEKNEKQREKIRELQKQLRLADDDFDKEKERREKAEEKPEMKDAKIQTEESTDGVDEEHDSFYYAEEAQTTPIYKYQKTQTEDTLALAVANDKINALKHRVRLYEESFIPLNNGSPITTDKALNHSEALRKRLVADNLQSNKYKRETSQTWPKMMKTHNDKKAEIAGLEKKLRMLEQNIGDSVSNAAEVQRLRKALETLEETKNAFKSKSEDLKKRLDGCREHDQDLTLANIQLNDKLRALEAEKQKAIAELEEKLKSLREEMEKRVSELSKEVLVKEKELGAIQAELEDIIKNHSAAIDGHDLEKENEKLKSDLEVKIQGLATLKQELETKEQELEDSIKEEKRLRNMLGLVIEDISAPSTPVIGTPAQLHPSMPISPSNIALPSTPRMPNAVPLPSPRSSPRSPLLPPQSAGRLPSGLTPPKRNPSPLRNATPPPPLPSIVLGLSSPIAPASPIIHSPQVLPPHPDRAPITFSPPPSPPQSLLIPDPSRFRAPGWEAREASWRNTEAYSRAMARFEQREEATRLAEEPYEAMRESAFKNLIGADVEVMSILECYETYVRIERAKYAVPKLYGESLKRVEVEVEVEA